MIRLHLMFFCWIGDTIMHFNDDLQPLISIKPTDLVLTMSNDELLKQL